jgi:hypothetical protein
MVSNIAIPSSRPQAASKIPLSPGRQTPDLDMHTELLSDCDRIARIWQDRCQADAALWSALADELANTKTVAEALNNYSICASKRMEMATENARRLFEEYQTMVQKYSAAADGTSRCQRSVVAAA